MIYPTASPANTTDTFVFASSNEDVATVSADGKIVAVSSGTATITVTCGSVSVTCTVECDIAEEPENTTEDTTETTADTTEDTTEDTTAPVDTGFKLNRKDITFSRKGDSWLIYDGNLPLTEIKWSSDDDTIATITNGKVVAVGSGKTEVHAEYNGEKVSCIIRCSFENENTGVAGNGGGVSEDGGTNGNTSENTGSNTCKVYTGYGDEVSDISIKVGETFTLHLKDASGQYISVTWTPSDPTVCSVADNSITGLEAGVITVSATHDSVAYSCIVRVRE